MSSKAYIPYGGYYSSPFCRWQGSLQHENAIVLGAKTANRWLNSRQIDPTVFDYLYFGITVAQPQLFYAHNWAAALLTENRRELPAVMIQQACTTAATCLYLAATGVQSGNCDLAFALTTDRCSNGPHTIWPQPLGPGAQVISEDWMMDNFNSDPNAGLKMIQTAENVSWSMGATREECDTVALRRYEQYQAALAHDRAFQKRYMFPLEVRNGRKATRLIEADEGITPCSAEGLAALEPVEPGGVHTYGSQTHPADGNCGFIVTDRDRARELSRDRQVEIEWVSYGYARSPRGTMAAAPVPAAEMALKRADLGIRALKAVKTHNPFAINDICMARKMGLDLMQMNNYGSSLIFGHPQGPTAGRLIIELIEELVLLGGGYGLWAGCAAGDTGAAVVLKVDCP